MKKIIYILSLLSVIAFGSCYEKEYFVILGPDGKPIENPGRLTVVGNDLPEGSTITILKENGSKLGEIAPKTATDMEAGKYKLVLVTPQDGLTVNGTVVTSTVPFSAGVSTATVVENKETEAVINLSEMTRRLVVKLSYKGFPAGSLSSIEMDVYNPAASVDVEKGFGAVVPSPSPERFARATVENPSSAQEDFTFHLLGFEPGGAHKVVARFITGDGVEVFSQDISGAVKGFNGGPAGSEAVLSVEVEMVDGEISGRIQAWEPGWEGEIFPN